MTPAEKRRRALRRIVRKVPNATVATLAQALRDAGHDASTGTVHRDLHELDLWKAWTKKPRARKAQVSA